MSLPMNRLWAIGLGGTAFAAIAAVVAFVLFTTLIARAASSVVQDPKGDVQSATESANQVGVGTPDDVARPWLDIKQVKVMKKNGKDEYVFSMVLGGPVPDDPSTGNCYGLTPPAGDTTTVLVNPPDPSACFFAWNWELIESPVFAGPSPLAPTVRWQAGAFQGIAFNTAGPPILFDDIKVAGATVTATLDASVVESHLDVSDGIFFAGVTRNHRVDIGGNPFVGVADVTEFGSLGN